MAEIVAANNLTIQYDTVNWQLFNGRSNEGFSILTARPGELIYHAQFAAARRMPPGGRLSAEQVAMVVVGWAVEDTSWHLGLLLTPEIAQRRGGRWCGLARWEDQDGDLAERAGRALASVLGKPFRLVPPPDQEAVYEAPIRKGDTAITFTATNAASADLPVAQPVAVMAPPIDMGEWLLEEDPQGVRFVHAPGWNRALLLRGMFFAALVPVFGLLSAGALLSVYAPVQPEWLPLVGLGITLVMLVAALWQFRNWLRGPVTLIDRRGRILRQTTRSGRRVLVQSPFEGLQYLLVSHVVNRRRTKKPSEGTIGRLMHDFWAEVWIHAYSPRRGFITLCHLTDIEGQMADGVVFRDQHPLNLTEIDSPAHHVAVIAAREIGIPVYVEER